MRAFILPLGLCLLFTSCSVDTSTDEQELLRLHEVVLQAHRDGDLESWMADEAELTLSANGGKVDTLERDQRISARQPYLENTTFSSYRDLIDPIAKVSDDGTLGWVIVEVEIIGESIQDDGSSREIASVWAWIELYEKFPDGWKRIGNVSNGRSLDS